MAKPPRKTAARGYGSAHQRLRRQLLPQAIGRPCPICGATMFSEHGLDLDHARPLALGGDGSTSRIVHSVCNRRRGQALGEAIKRTRRRGVAVPAPPPPPRAQSRDWFA